MEHYIRPSEPIPQSSSNRWFLLTLHIILRNLLRVLTPHQPARSLPCPNTQNHRPIKLELRIIFHGVLALFRKLIPIHQLRKQHFDLPQCEIEADAATRVRGERHVRVLGTIGDFVCTPAVGVETLRIRPDLGVVVDCVQGTDYDCADREFVAAGGDAVYLRGAAGLK